MKVMLFPRETLYDRRSLCRAPSICKETVLDLMRKKYMQDSFSPPVVLTLDSLGLTIITVTLVRLPIFILSIVLPSILFPTLNRSLIII